MTVGAWQVPMKLVQFICQMRRRTMKVDGLAMKSGKETLVPIQAS
jgi:hypothetical protein